MNGEIYQMCELVTYVKMLLKNNECSKHMELKKQKNINQVEIQFLYKEKINSMDEFAKILAERIKDIEIVLPVKVENRMNLGFSNSSSVCMRVYYKDGSITGFLCDYVYAGENRWNLLITEHNKERLKMEAVTEKTVYGNNKQEFVQALVNIRKFAYEIEEAEFAKIFEEAEKILNGNAKPEKRDCIIDSFLPNENRILFTAACKSDVFKAEGSWNDTCALTALLKKKKNEYVMYSDELLQNIRKAIMFAVNEY